MPVPSNSVTACSRWNGPNSLSAYAMSKPAPSSRTKYSGSPCAPRPTPNAIVLLPATTIVRAYVSYEITKLATLFVRAENFFNTNYEEVFSYRAPPFMAFAGLKVKLGN